MVVRVPVLFAVILVISSAVMVSAADPGSGPTHPNPQSPAQTPQLPPPAPPSRIDPGIQKEPATLPDPKGVVPPPVVDPKMSIDPEKKNSRSGSSTTTPNQGSQPAPPR